MIKRVTILTLACLLALPAISLAKDMTGKYGLGYFNSDAPVGARFWASERLGVDIGVGFESVQEMWSPDPGNVDATKESFTSFWFEAGFPYVVFPGDRANFFIRPGVVLGILDDRVYGTVTEDGNGLDETWTQITFSLTPGAEVFFGEHFSLEAGHGIQIQITTPPDAISDESFTDIKTFDASVTYLGFHFYFK